MREAGDILLVACYELGHQPLAVAWPAAFLERAGYRPALMDTSVEPVDEDKLARARVIAVSVPMHTALRLGLEVAARARAVNPAAHVCFFGLYATLNAELLFASGVDSVIGGEAEAPLLALIKALERGEAGAVPGVGRSGQPAAPHLRRLDFPVPSRSALPSIKKYAHLEHDGRMELTAYAEASRGCLHRCRHCPIPPVYGGRFFAVPREVVLADVRQQIEAGARHVTFGDPDFLNGPTHALAVARELHAEWPDVTFDFTAKIEHLLRHRAHLPALREAGCLFVVSAAESLSDTVLAHLDKGHTRADIMTALGLTREAGITLRPTWVAFTPWTTLDDHRAWLDFLADEGLIDHVDAVQYGLRLLVPPGSLLLESPAMRPHLGPLEPATLSHRWTHPDARMDRLQAETAAIVAKAIGMQADTPAIFDRVRAMAAETAGAAPPASVRAAMSRDRRRPPRLSEAWFC
jgi:radical SAM superfamily enzyme YgiQ (UPF0313 family)